VYFGKVVSDPKGQAALDLWLAQKDDLLAGRIPRAKRPEEATVKDLANSFLTHKQNLLTAGELSEWTSQEAAQQTKLETALRGTLSATFPGW